MELGYSLDTTLGSLLLVALKHEVQQKKNLRFIKSSFRRLSDMATTAKVVKFLKVPKLIN